MNVHLSNRAPLLAALLVATSLGPVLATDPAWTLEPSRIVYENLGDLDVQQSEILLVNDGPTPLTILDVGVSCEACLAVNHKPSSIAPGETEVIVVSFNPQGYRGTVEQSVTISTDHPTTPSQVISIRAHITPTFDIRGGPVIFEELLANETRRWNLYLTPRDPNQDRITWATSDSAGLSAEVVPQDRPGEVLIRIQTAPPQPSEGLIQSQILVGTADASEPLYAIPVLRQVVPPFRIEPPFLSFDSVNSEQLRMIFVRQHLVPPCHLTNVLVPNRHFRAEVIPDSGLPNYRINIYAIGLAGTEGELGSIQVETTCDEEQPWLVPVFSQPAGTAPVGNQERR